MCQNYMYKQIHLACSWTTLALQGPFDLADFGPCSHIMTGREIKKMFGRKFATSYENLVATLKMLVAKLIEAI